MAVCNVIQLSEIRSGFRIDAEFYKEEYLEKDLLLSKLDTLPLWRIAKVTDGEHGSVSFVTNGIKYLTAEHIKQGFVDPTGARFVSADVDQRNARARVSEGDVLISIKGTLGEIGLAEKSLLPANMNRDVAIIKPYPNSPLTVYLTVFLRSEFGAFQLSREGSGGVQQMITLERLKSVLIPLLNDDIQKEIATIHQKSLSEREESVSLYTQAKHLLESELGLDKLNFQKPVGYTARFSELEQSRRMDAEFFQPKYQSIISLIRNRPHTTLGGLFSVSRGIYLNPNVYNDTDGVPYMRIKELSLSHPLDPENSVKIPHRFVSAKFQTSVNGDYIMAVIGATIGKINLIDETMDGSLYSNNTACLSPKSRLDWPNAIELILRSPIVQHQIQQRMAKTAQEKITDPELKRILIPHLDSDLMLDLEKLCLDSKKNYFDSKCLLNQAKTRVEQLIEKAVQQ